MGESSRLHRWLYWQAKAIAYCSIRSSETCRRWTRGQTWYTKDLGERSSLESRTNAKTETILLPKMPPNRNHLIFVADDRQAIPRAAQRTSTTIWPSRNKREAPSKRLLDNRNRAAARSRVLCLHGKTPILRFLQAHGANAGCRSQEWSTLVPRSNLRLVLLAAGRRPEASVARTGQQGKQREISGTSLG